MINDYQHIYKNLKIYIHSKIVIFCKLRDMSLYIKSESKITFPFGYYPNIGKILIVQHLYQFFSDLKVGKIEKKSYFLHLNNQNNINLDLRDLCLKNGEIIQTFKLTILTFNKKPNIPDCISNFNFFFFIKTNRFSLNRNFFKLNIKPIFIDKKKLKYFLKFLEFQLFIDKRIFKIEKKEKLNYNDFGIFYYINNKYYTNKIQIFSENILYRKKLIFIYLIICLAKFYKLQKVNRQLIKLLN
nr:hypothetical protein CcurKRNrm3_p042 [Cryptomonas curvata]